MKFIDSNSLKAKWKRSLAPVNISPEPVDGFKNLNSVWTLNEFCIPYLCKLTDFKFFSWRVSFSA